MIHRACLIVLPLLVITACSDEEPAAPPEQRDPAIARALDDPLMTDPDFSSRNEAASAITVETGLSFLGLGVRPPTPSWGVIMADGFQRVRTAPWAVIWTCLALGITTLGCTLLGERLRDLFDPKLRGAGK